MTTQSTLLDDTLALAPTRRLWAARAAYAVVLVLPLSLFVAGVPGQWLGHTLGSASLRVAYSSPGRVLLYPAPAQAAALAGILPADALPKA